MAEFDHGIKRIAETTGRQLARLADVECQRWRPLESTLPITTELLADRVFRAQHRGERFIVYFEFYTKWDRNAPWDLLAKSGVLSQREKLPTLCIIVVLRRRGFRSPGKKFRLEAAGGPTQQLWFRVVCLWEKTPEPWWEDEPGLMAVYPLCRHRRPPREAITYAAQAIERKVSAAGQRADALALLAIFGGLAFPKLDVKSIIGSEKMKESRFIRELREEEALIQRRSAILQVLRARFGAGTETGFTATLDIIDDLTQLEPLLDLAATCISLDKFRTGLASSAAAT